MHARYHVLLRAKVRRKAEAGTETVQYIRRYVTGRRRRGLARLGEGTNEVELSAGFYLLRHEGAVQKPDGGVVRGTG